MHKITSFGATLPKKRSSKFPDSYREKAGSAHRSYGVIVQLCGWKNFGLKSIYDLAWAGPLPLQLGTMGQRNIFKPMEDLQNMLRL